VGRGGPIAFFPGVGGVSKTRFVTGGGPEGQGGKSTNSLVGIFLCRGPATDSSKFPGGEIQIMEGKKKRKVPFGKKKSPTRLSYRLTGHKTTQKALFGGGGTVFGKKF